MIAVILAAGAGRKMWPYAEVRNKCALPVLNVPAVRRLADQLYRAGVERIVVVLGAHGRSVRAALADAPAETVFVEQPRPEGSADALLHALPSVEMAPVLTVAGDLVTTQAVIDHFVAACREGCPAALAVPLGGERGIDWIGAEVRDGALCRVEGHGRDATHRLPGFYVLPAGAERLLLRHPGLMSAVPVGGMPPLEAELAQTFADLAASSVGVRAVEAADVVDLDKPWHILEANALALREAVETAEGPGGAVIDDGAEISGRVFGAPGSSIGRRVVARGDLWLGPGAQVTNGAILEGHCVIGAGSRVRDYALLSPGAVIGPEAVLGHGAEFSGVLFEGVYLYHYCEIYGVVGARVDIGAATVCGTLRFDDAATIHRVDGRREHPLAGANAAYLGDYSRTGVNAVLMPGVKVGAYACVGPGVVLAEDLPSRQAVFLQQQQVRRPWGPERYGW